MSKIKINVISTNDKIFMQIKGSSSNWGSGLNGYLFDGLTPDETFNKSWVSVKECPKVIEKLVPDTITNRAYVLKNDEFKSPDIPLEILYDDAFDIDGDPVGAYKEYGSLYELIKNTSPNSPTKIEFELNVIRKVDTITEPTGFTYPVPKKWDDDTDMTWKSNNAIFLPESTIMIPDVLIHETQATISSDDLYKVTRRHIKDNIDRDFAIITSDYDFCFTVEKRITLAKEEKYYVSQRTPSGKVSKKKPITKYRKYRRLPVFKMTPKSRTYESYPVIQPIIGKNLDDLRIKIDTFLEKVISVINKPLVDCQQCKGTGIEQTNTVNGLC